MLSKRLKKEAAGTAAMNEADSAIQLHCSPNNIHSWYAVIRAPEGSYYEGYAFNLSIEVGLDYPLTPPVIKFKTQIFHPNVLMESGEICLDILKKEWSPAWSIQSACRAIIALLADPAPESPLNCDAGNLLRANDFIGFRSVARMYCEEFCDSKNKQEEKTGDNDVVP